MLGAPFAPLNPTELARYVDLLDRLIAQGITPMVVLHHFSNPPYLIPRELGNRLWDFPLPPNLAVPTARK